MKRFFFITMMIGLISLSGIETDTETKVVHTGWTSEKQILSEKWLEFSDTERIDEINMLENRLHELMPRLPENEYSFEEERYIGYRVRLNEALMRLKNETTEWNYAEFAYLLDNAETFADYLERQKTLPVNDYEEIGGFTNGFEETFHNSSKQGVNWLYRYISTSNTDQSIPIIVAHGDTVFASVEGGDSIMVYRSVDGGNSFSEWYKYGSSTVSRWPFDMAIDRVNHFLYLSYYYTSGSVSGDIWVLRWDNLHTPHTPNFYSVETGTDWCHQPHLAFEHAYFQHKLLCEYYNATTDQVVIERSSDSAQTWTTEYTSSWTYSTWPRGKGSQGADGSTTDRFYFASKKTDTSLVVLESATGASGSWTETEYIHSSTIEAVDISASHNYNNNSIAVVFEYPWTPTDHNVRLLYRAEGSPTFVNTLIDGDIEMLKTPVIACDGDWAGNNPGPDYYHIAYYKDHDDDTYYRPFALRFFNDEDTANVVYKSNPQFHERVGSVIIDTLTISPDMGITHSYYQLDMTTKWDTYNSQWFPAITWLRYISAGDNDPRLAIPDYDAGIWEDNTEDERMNLSVHSIPYSPVDIKFVIPEREFISIKVYDVSGRLLEKITEGYYEAGTHHIDWNNKLNSGVYFLQLKSKNETETRSFTILK